MSFVELAFAPFLLITFLGYYLLAFDFRLQNVFLLIVSLLFYAWWDWQLVGVMIVSICITYVAAIGCQKTRWKRSVLIISIASLLGILGYFKYVNFFIASFNTLLESIGLHSNVSTLTIILPIGISFYTFQGIAYVVDVYRGKLKPYTDFVSVALFMTFFPHLVAGPIQRPSHLLEQLNAPRFLNRAVVTEAVWLMAYGYFMKVGIADVLAPNVQFAFSTEQSSGWWTLLGTYAFGLQIYSDFAGYSLIARGVALLFGIQFSWNFSFPYWSTSLVDFWRRWHISLSFWLRDYVYISMGGNRGSKYSTVRNILITMVLGGLWHGANWTFVIWGALHGAALSIEHLCARRELPQHTSMQLVRWGITMLVIFAGWFFFRISSIKEGLQMLASLSNMSWFPAHADLAISLLSATTVIALLEGIQVFSGTRNFVLSWSPWSRALLIAIMIFYVAIVSQHTETQFIYFQF